MAATPVDYEQAGELKFGQVGIANLRIRTLDPGRLAAEMAGRVQRAPKLSNAWVAAGHGTLGMSMSPASGERMAEMIGEPG